ncbi:gp149R [Rabbit fibroma virus]|uniref:Gp149R n=1 Tax=Rabbit fibroma virus (strain Kasza) TaxID=10272 RepID=Q9Q8T4_RFVKA|nr:ankyrin repeat protein [Rabbit fibroma virus]AAF18027.1 gp149R [Rabbit fibroma virus]
MAIMASLHRYISFTDSVYINSINFLLRSGFDVNSTYKGNSIITLYLKRPDVKIKVVKFLIDNGCDVNHKGYIETPLCAILKNRAITPSKTKKLVTLLLKAGADINLKSVNGSSPIVCFMHNSNINTLDMLRFMLRNGANVTVKNHRGYNLLHIYLEGCIVRKDVIRELLRAGVNPFETTANLYQLTPMNIYLRNTMDVVNVNVINYMLKKGIRLDEPTHESALESFLDNNKILLTKEITVLNFILSHVSTHNEYTPLLLAAKVDNQDAFIYLLHLGESIYTWSRENDTVLTYALKHGNEYIVNRILQRRPGKTLICKTFAHFSEHGFNDMFFNMKKMDILEGIVCYAFTIYPEFYKQCLEVQLMFPNIVYEYENSLKAMRSETIGSHSIYDLVFRRSHSIVPINVTKHPSFTKFQTSILYGAKIRRIILDSLEFDACVNEAVDVLNVYCKKRNYWGSLPIEIQKNILQHLTTYQIKYILCFKKKKRKFFI